jgi:DNA-binding XRE family transcriptional regulator
VLQKADPKLVYAAQVRAARALLGWSQGELAERAGISKQSVNRIESRWRWSDQWSWGSPCTEKIPAALSSRGEWKPS